MPAYSTLGWSNWIGGDPLLNTFVGGSEGELARLIFHELAHQVALRRRRHRLQRIFSPPRWKAHRRGGCWLEQHGDAAARASTRQVTQRRQDFAADVRYRDEFRRCYGAPAGRGQAHRQGHADGRGCGRSDDGRERWGGFAGFDAWFEHVNNVAGRAGRTTNSPWFERLYAQQGGDFERFYAAAAAIAALPKAERHAKLRANLTATTRDDRGGHPHSSRTRARPGQGTQVAAQWAEDVENFDTLPVRRGDYSDTIEFTRSGVNGRLIVAPDHFDLDAKLRFPARRLRHTIESRSCNPTSCRQRKEGAG